MKGSNPDEALGFIFDSHEIRLSGGDTGTPEDLKLRNFLGQLEFDANQVDVYWTANGRGTPLDWVNTVNGDWKFTYNEDMNTWLVQKSIMSWTVHVRTKAVIPDNNYCR